MFARNWNGDLPPRTKYQRYELYLTLEEIYNGTTRKLITIGNRKCRKCRGVCGEIGTSTITEDQCKTCKGRKVVTLKHPLYVKVKRGSREGQKIIFKGEGTQQPGLRAADVYVILHQKNHQIFQRDGDDLIMSMQLGVTESTCGFKKSVTTLDNRELAVSGPPGKVIRNGDKMYLPGEGMPNFFNPHVKGNLIIKFEVNLPNRISYRNVTTIEECLQPREHIDIPDDAVECNLQELEKEEEEEEKTLNDDGWNQYADVEYDDNGYYQERYYQEGYYQEGYYQQGYYQEGYCQEEYYQEGHYERHSEGYYEDNSYEMSYDATNQHQYQSINN